MSLVDHSIPLLVHAHYALDSEDLSFWLELAQSSGSPILELGCGTGRVLLHLAQAGFKLVGLDYDRSMLIFLRGIVPEGIAGRVHLVQADLAVFHLVAASR